MIFKDRESAAHLLLERLEHYRSENPIVAGIPRGAMPMAKIIAEGLGAELSAILVHKIPYPGNEEFAIGSVGLSGNIQRASYASEYGISEAYIQSAAQKQLEVLKKRQKKYGLASIRLKNRVVIIVDDGIATGATTMGAIAEVRSQGAQKIVLAAAVSSVSAAKEIKKLVDDFVVLEVPRDLFAVGQYFANFPQVTDETVIELLHGEHRAQL